MYQRLREGDCGAVWAVAPHRCPACELIESLSDRDRKKAVKLIEHFCDHGPPTNTQKFRKLGGSKELYELKPTAQIRFIGFFLRDGFTFVIAHALRKKSDRHKPKDLQKAERLREEFLDWWDGGGRA